MKKMIWFLIAIYEAHELFAAIGKRKKVNKKPDAEFDEHGRKLDTLAYDVLQGKYGYGEAKTFKTV